MKAPRASVTPRNPSPARLATDRVLLLTDQFAAQLAAARNSSTVNVEIVPSPGRGSTGSDIMAIAFAVLMEASKSAREDLKAVMENVKAINDAKVAWRKELKLAKETAADADAGFHAIATLYVDQVMIDMKRLSQDLNSMSEMGEMESLRLQMAMDRLGKLMSTLSNLLKKLSDTSSEITRNLK